MKRTYIPIIAVLVALLLVVIPVVAQLYEISNFSGIHLNGSFATATAVLRVAPPTTNAGNLFEVYGVDGTPAMIINKSGTISYATPPSMAGPFKVTVPTAQATATPGYHIDNLAADGDTLLLSQDGGTPVVQIDKAGNVTTSGAFSGTNIDASGYVKAGVATPAVVTSLGAGDGVFSDDVEVVDDLHVTGAMKVGVPTPVGMTWNDDDLLVGDDFEVIDDSWFNGMTTLTGGATLPLDATSGVGLPLVVSKSFTYTAAAGATYNGFIIPESQKLIIHSVLLNVTENFDCTDDDCTLLVGDSGDADGFLVLADAELQAADTEGTGFAAGWQGMADATIGVYLDEVDSGFVVVAPAGGYTVTYALDESSGDTLAGGAATLYMIYTRIE